MQLQDAKDNGTSITFNCYEPGDIDDDGNLKIQPVTLSDLGLARAYGINPKEYQRSEFVSQIVEMFPMRFGQYMVRDWELPIPEEWVVSAASYIKSMKDRRIFNSIDGSTLKYLDPPLYRWVVLNATLRKYPEYSPESLVIPSDLLIYKEHPEQLLNDAD